MANRRTALRRANKALKAAYPGASTGNQEDLQDSVTDLLADLRHFCLAHGWDYNALDNLSARHFGAEQAEAGATCPHTTITPQMDESTLSGSIWCPQCCLSVRFGMIHHLETEHPGVRTDASLTTLKKLHRAAHRAQA